MDLINTEGKMVGECLVGEGLFQEKRDRLEYLASSNDVGRNSVQQESKSCWILYMLLHSSLLISRSDMLQ